jgi:hypothetical protein
VNRPTKTADREGVSCKLAALERSGLDALRLEWRRVFKTTPSVRLSADLMLRAIAYRVQEAVHGGLCAKFARQLAATNVDSQSRARSESGMKPGTILVREWHGRTHTVRALEDGFDYEGRRYPSLTKIAREITGAAWSGPRFFGLVRPRATCRVRASQVDA